MKCANKVFVVTGAGSGMGRELVFELLRRRARVAAVDRNEATLAETAALAGAPGDALATFPLSVTDRARVEALPGAVAARLGPADGLLNCAGVIQPFVRIADLDYPAVEQVLDVNFRGTLYMTKAFLPSLLARPEAHVVNFSSMGGFLPVPGQAAYGASKAAVKLLTEGLRAELAQTRVRVTFVIPGAVATNIAANSGVAVGSRVEARRFPMLAADRAAREIVDGMERDRARILVGRDARFLDLFHRLAPTRAAAFVARQMKDLLPPIGSADRR